MAGYHVTAAYFLDRRGVGGARPSSPAPLDPLHGDCGPGAVEAFARLSQLDLSGDIFRFGLANPEDWTNNAYVTDVGFNWYTNRFVKFYFDWQHSFFGSPVLLNEPEGIRRRTSDLFWIRCQVWF